MPLLALGRRTRRRLLVFPPPGSHRRSVVDSSSSVPVQSVTQCVFAQLTRAKSQRNSGHRGSRNCHCCRRHVPMGKRCFYNCVSKDEEEGKKAKRREAATATTCHLCGNVKVKADRRADGRTDGRTDGHRDIHRMEQSPEMSRTLTNAAQWHNSPRHTDIGTN